MEIVGSNPLNKDSAKVRVSHSRFDLERHVLGTYRFGEYAPFFFFDGVGSDSIRQRSVTTTRSLSLNAPLMENINMKRDYFAVYYDAILPHNWQKVYVNPKKGDDVDASKVGCSVVNFGSKIVNYFIRLKTFLASQYTPSSSTFDFIALSFFRYIFLIESICSHGSLLASLGINVDCRFRIDFSGYNLRDDYTIDEFVDIVAGYVIDNVQAIAYNSKNRSEQYILGDAFQLRAFFDRVRDGESFVFSQDIDRLEPLFDAFFLDGDINISDRFVYNGDNDFDLDLARPVAYQLACAHFYTNDNIDYLYSCELYRDYIGYLLKRMQSVYMNTAKHFTYNGVDYPLDWLSSGYFDFVLSDSSVDVSQWATLNEQNYVFAYFRAIFGFNRSLRFMDYFTGAKSQPLAVGDVNVAVNDNLVSVVDVTRNIQFQRFLNNINRIPQQLDGYIRKMFPGASPGFDYHNPAWLAHTNDVVFTAEVENTGEAQMKNPNSVTATFRGNSSDKEFTFDCDKPCIIIGIQYFDIRRAYSDGVDRLAQHVDRFDRFIPEMQFIGDQEVRGSELVSWLGKDPISYQGRNEEYKQVNDIAFGGFASKSLPGWAFLFDASKWFLSNPGNTLEFRISPDFIRSRSVELDSYFLELTGFSLGTYFHFIQKIVNITSANRPMVRNPQILG